jgi:hypothetical protein
MANPTQEPIEPIRLRLDGGEVVEVNGSELYDGDVGEAVPAVLVRLPGDRAHWLAHVLDAYTRVCALVDEEFDAAEAPLAWALDAAAAAVHDRPALRCASRRSVTVTSGQRMAAAAVLREAEDFDGLTLIAVADAAARWMDEDGSEYAYQLLAAVTEEAVASRAYAALLRPAGGGGQGGSG